MGIGLERDDFDKPEAGLKRTRVQGSGGNVQTAKPILNFAGLWQRRKFFQKETISEQNSLAN
jgi:hypothetical protein